MRCGKGNALTTHAVARVNASLTAITTGFTSAFATRDMKTWQMNSTKRKGNFVPKLPTCATQILAIMGAFASLLVGEGGECLNCYRAVDFEITRSYSWVYPFYVD